MRRRDRALRRRYGRSMGPVSYRGYELVAQVRHGRNEVDVLRPSTRGGGKMFVEATTVDDSKGRAIDKAKRVVDAMHGD
jgi:hypothetical protein